MTRLVLSICLNAVALALTAYLVPQWLYAPPLSSLNAALELLWAGLLLGVANAIVRPVLLFFSFPITVLTFGLFALVVNAVVLLLVVQFSSLDARGFGGAFGAALVLMVLNAVLHWFLPRNERRRKRDAR